MHINKNLAEQPYDETCSICRSTLFSAHDCYNARPIAEGFCCNYCYNEKVRPAKRKLDKIKEKEKE